MYESMRFSAKKCKIDWVGGSLSDWSKWRDAGWRVHAVTVDAKLIPIKLG